MKRVLVLICLTALVGGVAFAQESVYPKAEVFGGYSLINVDTGSSTIGRQNASGWNAAVTGNFNKVFGFTADVSRHYQSISGQTANMVGLLFGPEVSYRVKNVKPFAHGLFGVEHVGGDVESDNAWALALGGGLDIKVSKMLSIRLGQADFLRTNFGGQHQNNFRFSTGVVFRFGEE